MNRATQDGMERVAKFVDTMRDEGDKVITVRPSATALLCIDSDDRYADYNVRRTNPSYPFSYSITKNESLLNGFAKRLALTEFRLNWTLPNIATPWRNNGINIYYTQNPNSGPVYGPTAVILRDRFYGAEELAAELQYQITAASPTSLAGFIVQVAMNQEDNVFQFIAPAGWYFFFAPGDVNIKGRQLCDMLNVKTYNANPIGPFPSTWFTNELRSGIPNLRPMDYFDVVCSQLNYNQRLADTTSAPITRDIIARIYLDDSVPSQSHVNTNYYNTTRISTSITAVPSSTMDPEVTFTVASTSGFTVGSLANVVGTVGGVGWNSDVEIVEITSSTVVRVVYLYAIPTGTVSSVASASLRVSQLTQVSNPVTTWDDRVNSVSPFVIYRQFAYPKQIRWNGTQPIGNLTFELYDDQGRSFQELWNAAYPAGTATGFNFANSFVWNASILVSED